MRTVDPRYRDEASTEVSNKEQYVVLPSLRRSHILTILRVSSFRISRSSHCRESKHWQFDIASGYDDRSMLRVTYQYFACQVISIQRVSMQLRARVNEKMQHVRARSVHRSFRNVYWRAHSNLPRQKYNISQVTENIKVENDDIVTYWKCRYSVSRAVVKEKPESYYHSRWSSPRESPFLTVWSDFNFSTLELFIFSFFSSNWRQRVSKFFLLSLATSKLSVMSPDSRL